MLLDDGKETLGVTALDASPTRSSKMPGDSLLPVILALGMAILFGGMLVINWWTIGAGRADRAVTLLLWLAPPARDPRKGGDQCLTIGISPCAHLPLEGKGQRSSAWWGMLCLIATEAILFVYLIFSYAYLGTQSPVPGRPPASPAPACAGRIRLSCSAAALCSAWGTRAFERRRAKGTLQIALAATLVMGAVFVAVQGMEWHNKPFSLSDQRLQLGLFHHHRRPHGACRGRACDAGCAIGVVVHGAPRWALQHLSLGALYWHFVDAVWLVVFTTLYLVPTLS